MTGFDGTAQRAFIPRRAAFPGRLPQLDAVEAVADHRGGTLNLVRLGHFICDGLPAMAFSLDEMQHEKVLVGREGAHVDVVTTGHLPRFEMR